MNIVCAESVLAGEKCFSHLGDLNILPDEAIDQKVLQHADVLVTRSSFKVTQDLLRNTLVKIVATATSGIDHIQQEYLAANEIQLISAHGSNANSVAEYVVAALLQVAQHNDITLTGKTLGIIGFGVVGRQVAHHAKLLGLNIIANDPPLMEQAPDTVTAASVLMPLPELLRAADIISLHPRLHRDAAWPSYHLADEDFFSQVRPGAIFINTSRGGVVDTQALLYAIESGMISHSIIDVWEDEPYYEKALLTQADIATPHISGYSYEARLKGTYQVYEEVCKYLNVTPEVTWKSLGLHFSSTINLDVVNLTPQQAMFRVMRQVCDVEQDDYALRATASGDAEQRALSFRMLKRKYGVRWECPSYTVQLPQSNEVLARTLEGFGLAVKVAPAAEPTP